MYLFILGTLFCCCYRYWFPIVNLGLTCECLKLSICPVMIQVIVFLYHFAYKKDTTSTFGKRAWNYCMCCRIALFKSLAERKKKEGISKAIIINVSSWMAWICFSTVALITLILIPAQFQGCKIIVIGLFGFPTFFQFLYMTL